MLLILPVTADSSKIQDAEDRESSTTTPQIVSLYDSADFTIAVSDPDLLPEDLFKSANSTLNNYTALFGKTVTPITLSDASLPENSLNMRKTLSGSTLSASPMSEGHGGIPPVIVADRRL